MVDFNEYMELPLPYSYWVTEGKKPGIFVGEYSIGEWIGHMKRAVYSPDAEYQLCLKFLSSEYGNAFVTNWLRKFLKPKGERDCLLFDLGF